MVVYINNSVSIYCNVITSIEWKVVDKPLGGEGG